MGVAGNHRIVRIDADFLKRVTEDVGFGLGLR
jgi:hypothetical protein